MLTADRLRELVSYDPETGVFVRRDSGVILRGADNGAGYLYATIGGLRRALHRFAWLYMTGRWPAGEIDHVNTRKADNRWANLRAATRSQNEFNKGLRADSTSGFKGVSWHKCKSRWRAHITVAGRHISLGYHPTPEAAHAAYLAAANNHAAEFSRSA